MWNFFLVDDRFILKQMPRLEVQSFLDFAPHYFNYITNAVQQKVEILNRGLWLPCVGLAIPSVCPDRRCLCKSRACLSFSLCSNFIWFRFWGLFCFLFV